jgi:hypothetical protein
MLSVIATAACLPAIAIPFSTSAQAVDPSTGEFVIGAVGDMACDPSSSYWNGGLGNSTHCGEAGASSAMAADTSLDAVLGLGDYQYDCGDLGDYATSYTPTWGRLNAKMDPIAGNHEYKTGTDAFGAPCPTGNTTAANYFTYFGANSHPEAQGHYSYDLGAWHLIGLNANCSNVGGCGATSAETKWLKADLAATTQPCILAYWHQPLYTGEGTGYAGAYKPWWDALYAAHADVVLNGHIHNYQRFAPMNSARGGDQAGPTEYIVGTGGEELVSASAKTTTVPKPVVWKKSFGYLRLTLHSNGWDAAFSDSTGRTLDASAGSCH